MADVTGSNKNLEGLGENAEVAALAAMKKSDFHKYLQQNPDGIDYFMKVLASLYNAPMKLNQVPNYVEKHFAKEKVSEDMSQQLKSENIKLQNEIFDLQDTLLALEKEYDEIKEEEL